MTQRIKLLPFSLFISRIVDAVVVTFISIISVAEKVSQDGYATFASSGQQTSSIGANPLPVPPSQV